MIMMDNNSEYENLFSRVSAIECSDEKLTNLKDVFAGRINSKRQLQRIKELRDLLQTLRKRDYINPHNVDVLADVASRLGQFSIIKSIFTQYNLNNGYNNNSTIVNNSHENYNAPTQNHQNNVIPSLARDTKHRIYQVIASDIGRKWSDLARALDVPEGYIDHLVDHTRSIDRVYEILRFHEDRCDRRVWWSSLLDGLTSARHNELRKKVQHIFDTHNTV